MSLPLRVAAKGLNLRAAPGTSAPELRVLGRRTLVVPGIGDGAWQHVAVPELRLAGWVAAAHLEEIPGLQHGDPMWLALMSARLGEAEIPGEANNPWILEAHATTSLHSLSELTAWCAASANWCLSRSGVQGTGSAAARDFLTSRHFVPLTTPRRGALLIYDRRDASNPTAAHVTLYVGDEARAGVPGKIGRGGNQSNSVCDAWHPDTQLLGIRWPAGV